MFPLAAQSLLEREHNAMSVSICYCQSLPRSPPHIYCLFGARFIHFLWVKSLIFLLARVLCILTARVPASWAVGSGTSRPCGAGAWMRKSEERAEPFKRIKRRRGADVCGPRRHWGSTEKVNSVFESSTVHPDTKIHLDLCRVT